MAAKALMEGIEGDLSPARYVMVGTAAKLGEMDAALVWIPADALEDLGARKVLVRNEFNVNAQQAGNRYIVRPHVLAIERGILARIRKLLIGTAVLAIDPKHVEFRTIRPLSTFPPQSLVEVRIKHGGAVHILDFQHRNEAMKGVVRSLDKRIKDNAADADAVWKRDLLRQSSIPVLLIREGDMNEIQRMFVDMARTKPIAASLIAVMDLTAQAHEIAVAVAKRVEMLRGDAPEYEPAGALEYTRSNVKGPGKLYPAAAWRTACSVILGGFRDRTPEQREQSVAQAIATRFGGQRESAITRLTAIWNCAYGKMPGWREVKAGTMSRDKFRGDYVHGNASGLYTFAGAIAAAEVAGVPYTTVIDALAKLPWERAAITKPSVPGQTPPEKPVHPQFPELVRYVPDIDKQGTVVNWALRTGGGARSSYEQAVQTVLQALAGTEKTFENMAARETLVTLGLVRNTVPGPNGSGGRTPKRGRPARKA
jgi:hypothetical protein